jgi:hypothetical protein
MAADTGVRLALKQPADGFWQILNGGELLTASAMSFLSKSWRNKTSTPMRRPISQTRSQWSPCPVVLAAKSVLNARRRPLIGRRTFQTRRR